MRNDRHGPNRLANYIETQVDEMEFQFVVGREHLAAAVDEALTEAGLQPEDHLIDEDAA